MKILVSGAAGFIGKCLLDEMTPSLEVWAQTRRTPPPRGASKVSWIRTNLSLPLSPRVMPKGVQTVIHLAQSAHFRDFPGKADDVFEVNVGGTFRLLEWARASGVRRFIYFSSGGIYGHGQKGFREEDLLRPQGPLGFYLASKRCAELMVETYAEFFSVIIARPFFVYGLGQKPGMLVPRLVRRVAEGKPIQLQGRDGLRLNPIHVRDVVRSLKSMIRLSGSHIVNLAGPEVLTMRRLGEIISGRLGRPARFEIQAAERPRHLIGDISRMKELLGAPRIRFGTGVAELCRSLADGRASSP
jgi:UDP-glucose 4-epimerase